MGLAHHSHYILVLYQLRCCCCFSKRARFTVQISSAILILGSRITFFITVLCLSWSNRGDILLFLQFKRYQKVRHRIDLFYWYFLILFCGYPKHVVYWLLVWSFTKEEKIHTCGMALLFNYSCIRPFYLSSGFIPEIGSDYIHGVGELSLTTVIPKWLRNSINLMRNLYFD